MATVSEAGAPVYADTAAPTMPNAGAPEPRKDARAKVTGAARYPADVPAANLAYGYLILSPVAKGQIAGFDLGEAERVPGVLRIYTHRNLPSTKPLKHFSEGGAGSTGIWPLAGPEIVHAGQIVGMVVAESYEAAREAAHKARVDVRAEPPAATFGSEGAVVQAAGEVNKQHEDVGTGDAEKALADAEVVVDAEYATPTQHHNPMELFATTAVWDGDDLTIHEPSQWVYGLRNGVAEQLGIDPARVRVVSPYVGGAFGSKGSVTPRTALVAQAARELKRPVKLVVPRDQAFFVTTHRAETTHRVRLGASRDGKLVAYSHEGWEVTSRPDVFVVAGTENTARMYAAPNIATKVNVVRADRNTPGFMRSPPEVPYMYALESAMDELAVALKMDPVELRRVNDTMTDPITGNRYTSRSLMACYDAAAEAFGWRTRNPEPGSMRDGDWQIGWGCATATYPTQMSPATARVRLTSDGRAAVQVAAHDLGTGAYTVIGQMAAERLGLPLDAVEVALGDTNLPPGPVAGGSITTASTCSAVHAACETIRKRLFGAAVAEGGPLAAADLATLDMREGRIAGPDGRTAELRPLFEKLGAGAIEEYAEWLPKGVQGTPSLYNGAVTIVGGAKGDRPMFAFGAEFVEVRVNRHTGEIRVPRAVGAFAGGRIMNPRTARSQYLGGMVWGIGSALHEATEIDRATARYVNTNIAEYLIPVNADVPRIEIIMVPEIDTEVNPAGVKGIGELANVGTAAAITNAIHHATGKRLRHLPVRMEELLGA